MKNIWFVENSEVLSKLHVKYKDRVLGTDPRIILPFYNENGKLIMLQVEQSMTRLCDI